MSGGSGSLSPALGPAAAARGPWSAGRARGTKTDRFGDALLKSLCAAASLLAVVILGAIFYQVLDGASAAFSQLGIGFLVHEVWQPNFGHFGAATFIYGTVVVSLVTMVIAVPLAISIGLYLSTTASGRVRSVVGPLVEMLAAIPSVILGFWGLIVLAPFLQAHAEPFLHSTLGFLPLFGKGETTGLGLFTASLILTIMVVPIVAAISRDLFLTVPKDLQDGAIALGATRWEVVRGVILPSAASGVVAAAFLGLGRALGEAIATLQVIGGGNFIHASLFGTGGTLASRIAEDALGTPYALQLSAVFYLGAILLAMELVLNLAAQAIMRRFDAFSAVAAR